MQCKVVIKTIVTVVIIAFNDYKVIENTISIFSKDKMLERKYQESISTIKSLELKAEEDHHTLDWTLQTL